MVKYGTNSGFTLVELCIALVFSSLLLGGLVYIYGFVVKEYKKGEILYNGERYHSANSMEVRIRAFKFHSKMASRIEKSPIGLCFGGSGRPVSTLIDIPPLKLGANIESLVQQTELATGGIRNTRELVDLMPSFFDETLAQSKNNWSFLVFGESVEDTILVQTRVYSEKMGDKVYNLYSVKMYSAKGDLRDSGYAFYVLKEEDPLYSINPICRYFKGEKQAKEVLVRASFPDPCLYSNLSSNGNYSLSRFTYTIDGF